MTSDDRTIARIRASYPIERRLMLDILIPADATPTDAHAVLSRVVADASIEIAERDEIIGRRERDIASLQEQLASAMADLNATRAELAAIRAIACVEPDDPLESTASVVQRRTDFEIQSADVVRHERDALRAEVAELRNIKAVHDEERGELRQILGIPTGLYGTGVLAEYARKMVDAWTADAERCATLESRPVLTVERLAGAIRSQWSAEQVSACGESTIAAALMLHLGAVTLPTPDRAAELAREIHRARLARLGQEANAIGIPAIDDIRTALAKLAPTPAPTPSKPADVFAGVSVEELAVAFWTAKRGRRLIDREGINITDTDGISAVLDALRVKLVAPVDPAKVARVALDPVEAATRVGEWKTSVENVRAYLTARGIPVTPESPAVVVESADGAIAVQPHRSEP